jgi:hypothetical protein
MNLISPIYIKMEIRLHFSTGAIFPQDKLFYTRNESLRYDYSLFIKGCASTTLDVSKKMSKLLKIKIG